MAGAERKPFLLRLPPDLWKELEKWAADELRSVNGQIEYLLREAVAKRKNASRKRRRANEYALPAIVGARYPRRPGVALALASRPYLLATTPSAQPPVIFLVRHAERAAISGQRPIGYRAFSRWASRARGSGAGTKGRKDQRHLHDRIQANQGNRRAARANR